MTTFLVLVLSVVAVVLFVKVGRLNRRLEEQDERQRDIIARLYALEMKAAPPPVPVVQSVAPPPPPPAADAMPLPRFELPPEPVEPVTVRPTWSERLREKMQGEEWEAVVGGSVLNKLGVLVTVVGLALFLSYSLNHMGPAGRVAAGYVLGLGMLAAGVVLERRPRYRIYGRGLIAGGWAAVYFTSYAAHALDAARVVTDPFAAAVLLAAVSAAMVLHALRYQSQTVAGLAYFMGFITLSITPVTAFSVGALVPLAVSLAWLAYRFSWNQIAIGGAMGTYIVFLVNAARSTSGNLAAAQTVLVVYWLVFECLDILDAARRLDRRGVMYALSPLNVVWFLVASASVWAHAQPANIYKFWFLAMGLYLAGAIVRARVRPPSSFQSGEGTFKRLWAGGYEGALTLTAVLSVVALCEFTHGLRLTLCLLGVGETLFLSGVLLKQRYPRDLGSVLCALPVARLVVLHLGEPARHVYLSRSLYEWTPVAALAAVLFYVNRALRPARVYFGYVAAALLVLILGYEVPREYIGPAWVLLAGVLFEFGMDRARPDFRYQGYGAGLAGVASLAIVNVCGAGIAAERPDWIPQLAALTMLYGAAARLIAFHPDALDGKERGIVRDALSASGSAMLAMLAWTVLPAELVAVAWALEGLLLVELGYALRIPFLQYQGHAAGALAFGRLFMANFTLTGVTGIFSHRVLTVLPVVILHYYLWKRLRDQGQAQFCRVYLHAAAFLAFVLMRFELGRVLAVAGWSLFALLLLALGIRYRLADLRWQSYLMAIAAFLRSWNTNFYVPESFGGWPSRVLTGAVVIACFYASELLCPRRSPDNTARARIMFSLLATALLAVLLYYEVSGALLTVAWGIEGVALMVAGFSLRERVMRLSGLTLLAVCIGKLFFHDLRRLDTPHRILSFILLGVFLLGVSWIYTRFREAIRRYL